MMALAELPTSKTEQRVDARHELEVAVTIASDTHFFAGLSGDVSCGGIFIATFADIRVGQRIFVHLALLDQEISAVGTVRWRREARDSVTPGVGVRFDDLDATSMTLIEKFCAARPPIYVDDEPA
ncbi:MAG: PilZ domain-containing protein [Polyangiaceae bacterium]